jgi:hypothetical protein
MELDHGAILRKETGLDSPKIVRLVETRRRWLSLVTGFENRAPHRESAERPYCSCLIEAALHKDANVPGQRIVMATMPPRDQVRAGRLAHPSISVVDRFWCPFSTRRALFLYYILFAY